MNIKDLPKEKMEQLFLMVAGGAALLAASWYLVVKPQFSKFSDLSAKTTLIEKQLQTAESEVRAVPRKQALVQDQGMQISAAERKLVGDGSFGSFLRFITETATTVDLFLKDTRQRDDIKDLLRGTNYFEYWVATSTVAPYHQVGRWINAMEVRSPFIRVVNLKMFPVRDSNNLQVDIIISFLVKN